MVLGFRPNERHKEYAARDGSKIVYKITYPNGKIYLGKDLTNSANYWGSAQSNLIAKDFSSEERMDMTIRREVLFMSSSEREINEKEVELIRLLESNDPKVGYNQWPKMRST